MLVVDIPVLAHLIEKISLKSFYQLLVRYIYEDFLNWDHFTKCPRISFKHKNGIMELMPIYTHDYFANKYVCTHKDNHHRQRYVVMGQGLWVDAHTGTPLMITEMTILTALRTAAVSLLVSQQLLKPDCRSMSIIGCGAQSHFQLVAHAQHFKFKDIRCYDIDTNTMMQFVQDMAKEGISVRACPTITDAVKDVDFIISLTNANRVYPVLSSDMLKPGVHINAMGGDAPGMSELAIDILQQAELILIEYFDQTKVEGEIQQFIDPQNESKIIQLSEFLKSKFTRQDESKFTIFDGVGIALLDYSTLRLVWDLCQQHQLGYSLEMLPPYHGDKNLFKFIAGLHHT
jgi:ornithine cyclodeaminase